VRTINELPPDYAGHITILLNDREPMIVIRNILLLMLLGTTKDIPRAAEIALHFWYSAFLRLPHQLQLMGVLKRLSDQLDDDSFSLQLGRYSVMTGTMSMRTKALLAATVRSDLDINTANNEIHRVKFVIEFF
jgi:Domain of unknown function (DUF4470)